MTKPDFVHNNQREIVFVSNNFHDAMIKLLNWLEETSGDNIQTNSGIMHQKNDFYAYHDSIRCEYDHEWGDFHISINCGEEIVNV